MVDLLIAAIIGIIEGITEFLPVSSTGHLLLFQNFINRPQSDFFNVIIQVAAVVAVIPLFKERIKAMFLWSDPKSKDLFIKTSVAFILTGFLGLIMKKMGLELSDNALPIAWALLIGGLLFIILEKWFIKSQSKDDISWNIVLLVVLGQIIAMSFPGASRSGSTIILMLIAGLNRERATEFSFLVGIPTMLAAGGYEAYSALQENSIENVSFILTSVLFSALTAFISVKWLLSYIKQHTFELFGVYRVIIAIVLFALTAIGIMN